MSAEEKMARLRIEEEAKKVMAETGKTRKLKQRQLIGDKAEDIIHRKDHVEDAKKQWDVKGTEPQGHGAENIESNVAAKARQAYEENLKEVAEKGRHHEALEAGGLSEEVTGKWEKSTDDSNVPLGFSKSSIKQPKDSTPANNALYSDGFSKIESQEVKMVGTSKHITTTGIDSVGRRVTKTKIVLPEQVGETKVQHQHGASKTSSDSAEANNNMMPNSWDGSYYSLTDIRQRKVEGIDKNYREQYLSPEDFQHSFKISKEEYCKLPKWKRDNLKRDLHLF